MEWLAEKLTDLIRPWHDDGLPEELAFGEIEAAGKSRAVRKTIAIMMIGEQPGDREDIEGHPFVGPAGQVLDQALQAAAIDRSLVYVTNVVKHFKWTSRGKRRIHERPDREEISACIPWLEAEVATVKPDVIVCLGATAAQALLGSDFRVTRQRGQIMASTFGAPIMATVHPSSILRARDDQSRREAMESFIADLRHLRAYL